MTDENQVEEEIYLYPYGGEDPEYPVGSHVCLSEEAKGEAEPRAWVVTGVRCRLHPKNQADVEFLYDLARVPYAMDEEAKVHDLVRVLLQEKEGEKLEEEVCVPEEKLWSYGSTVRFRDPSYRKHMNFIRKRLREEGLYRGIPPEKPVSDKLKPGGIGDWVRNLETGEEE